MGFAPYTRAYMHVTGMLFVERGLLPRAGGWEDQDARWWDALTVWLRYYQRARREANAARPSPAVRAGDDAAEALFAGGGRDWREVINNG